MLLPAPNWHLWILVVGLAHKNVETHIHTHSYTFRPKANWQWLITLTLLLSFELMQFFTFWLFLQISVYLSLVLSHTHTAIFCLPRSCDYISDPSLRTCAAILNPPGLSVKHKLSMLRADKIDWWTSAVINTQIERERKKGNPWAGRGQCWKA